jgi:hypothetical protein
MKWEPLEFLRTRAKALQDLPIATVIVSIWGTLINVLFHLIKIIWLPLLNKTELFKYGKLL